MPTTGTGIISITTGAGSAGSIGNFTVTANRLPNTQQGSKLVGTGNSGASQQGYSVALSADGNTAIIGGYGDNSSTGAAWIYVRSGSNWVQQGNKLVGSSASAGTTYQGSSVALSADGNTAIVGGINWGGTYQGTAWIYVRNGTTWSLEAGNLAKTGETNGVSCYGAAVALSADGNTAVIGGYADNINQGGVWVYKRSGGVWSQQGNKLTASDPVGNPRVGYSLALSADGNTIIAGGYGDNGFNGSAWIFTQSGGTWSQQGNKLLPTGFSGLYFGKSVAISADGNTAIIGADGENASQGAAFIFTRSGSTWSQQGNKLVGTGNSGAAGQGISVCLTADGNTAMVGGYTDNSNAGATWLYTRSGNTWTQQGTKLTGTGNSGNPMFGYAVALSADSKTAIIGGYTDNSSVGAAWLHTPVAGIDANLSALTTTAGTLSPTFAAATTAYTASVINAVSSVTVTPTKADANASIQVQVNAGGYVTVTSGAASSALSLNVGNNAIDVKVTAEDGTTIKIYTITITRSVEPSGNALNFDGSDDFVGINAAGNTATNFTSASTFTIEAWIKPGSNALSSFISHKASTTVVDGYALFVNYGSTSVVGFETKNSGLAATRTINNNVWNHIAFVYNAGTATFYINGLAAGSGAIAITASADQLRFGMLSNGVYAYNGSMDEVRFWNTARTASEIQTNMFAPVSNTATGLIAYYNFDAGSGTALADLTSNTYTGTLNNFALTGTASNWVESYAMVVPTASAATTTSGLVAYYNFDAGTAGATNTGITTLIDGTSNALNGTLTNFALTGSTSNWVESYAMVVPTATAATSTAGISFTANWTAPVVGTVDNYLLDVSTSSTFASAISGSPFTVAGTSKSVTGLTAGTIYYYRVRADKTSVTGQGGYSNAITVTPPIVVSSVTGSIVACAGTASTSYQQFTVAGTGLTNDIVVTAPTDFQVSVTAGSGYGSSVTLTQTSGTVSSTIIYVRSAASATSNGSGNVAISSIGQATINLALSSTINALPTGTLLPATQTICSGTAISNISFSSATTNIKAFSMQTGAATFLNSDQSGIFFDITNNSAQPVLVTNLVIAYLTRNALGANTNASFDVYKTSSATTAVGNYTTSSAWTKINSTSFTFPSGTAASTYYNLSADLAANSFTLAAGASIGMYVVANTAGFSIIYRNAATSTTSDTDGLLTMTSRVRSTGLFLQDNTARSFFGNINYQIFSLSRSNTTNVTGTGNAGNTTDTANVISGTLTNTTNTPQTTTYTYNIINSNNCAATVTANVIVNPVPNVATISNQTVCAGTSVTAINFTGNVTGTSYSWTNDNTTIGLAASGTGDIASFTATNTGSTPITATITVTPSYTNAGSTCTGSAITFTVTVNPKPTATLGTIVGVTTAATSFDVPYSGLTASPNQYSIIAGSPTALPSFAAVTNASLTTSPLAVTIPASSAGTYNFNFSLRNSTTGCVSDAMPFSLTVLSTNADLSALTTTAGTLSPTFAAATTAYTASVINAVSSVTVTATKADANASIQVQVNSGGYATVASGAASSALSLNVGSNTIDVKVTAEDGTTIKTYTITVTRAAAASTNANLSALDISAGTLAPTFGASIITYTASVAVSSITVTPTKADANASIQVQVNSGGYATVASGAASSSLSLNLGSNTVDVKVTAEDGTTIKTYSITVTRAMTAPGNALAFDGTDDYVSVPHNAVLNVTKFTLETWFYWSPATTSDIQFISCKGLEAMEIHTAGASGANGLRFIPRTGVYLDVTNAFTTNAWYHIAVVYDPTSSYAKIYINGIERSFSLTGSLSSAMVNNATALNIGRRTTGQYYLKGKLDEFRIWNVVRTQAEIQASMMNTINAATSGLVAYYNFDAGTASGTNTGITTLTDGTSNALNGTLTNIALTGSTSNWVESYAMVIPTTTVATSIAGTSFIANWTAPTVGTVDNYLLDVSTSSTFASAIAGSPFTVAGASKSLTSLTAGTNYYYRVRADKTSVTGQGGYSATITASTISNNSSLSNLVLSTGTLSPTFATATTSYTTSVSVPSITVTPTAAAGTSTITVNGNAITSGAASGSIALSLGSNTITVVVTAQDASTTTYTITVTRSLSTNANLGSLVLSSGTLAPTFAAATISYTASVTNATTSITVTPTLPANTTSTITVNGNTVASGVASGSIALSVGANTITTIVTAEDGSTTKTYTVTVTRVASATATLSSLVLNAGSLSPAFASATIAYTASVSYGTTAFTVTPTVADATATVTVNGNAVTSGSASGSIALNVGSNTITTIVTAQDGITTKTYTVTVTRGAVSPGNALGFSGSKVTVSALNISPGVYNQLTISVWANRTAGTGSYASIVSNDDGGYDRAITTYSDNTYHIFAGRDIATGVPAVLNSWEYITVYWSGTAVKMYKNGVLVLNTSGETASSSSIGTIIGNNNNNLSYPGRIDEVSLWNRELTAGEVTANMTSSINVATATGLIGYYTFDQGTAGGNNAGITTLIDNSTGGRNGVLTSGFALTGTGTNWIESYAMVVPVATTATNVSTTSFTANWTAPVTGTVDNGYVVDVSTVSTFASVITGSPFAVASGASLNVSGLAPATNYYYRVRADKTSVTGQGAYTATTNVTTLTTLVWNGSVSNAWGTAANWTPASVPTSADPVTIPTGASNMPVQVTATESANGISIQSGASLTIDGTLQVTKAVSNSGSLSGTGTLILNGTTQQALTGNISIGNLTLNNSGGAIINSGMVSITGTLTPTLGTLTTGGFLTLKSDANGTARIAPVTGAISGNVTVERYIPAGKRGFRLLTPTVTTTTFIKGNWQEGANNTSLLYASNQNPVAGYGTHITGSATGLNGFDATLTATDFGLNVSSNSSKSSGCFLDNSSGRSKKYSLATAKNSASLVAP
ncbi:unnamed protein product [Rotaria sordida]|uniref:Fibronectin type-III domain-containing protein n=1 Tax=Rotaria sordida TaxID=392033 RepID=A0A813WX60_9BILA|nr:unnamed protein product [Rotaria sordida]